MGYQQMLLCATVGCGILSSMVFSVPVQSLGFVGELLESVRGNMVTSMSCVFCDAINNSAFDLINLQEWGRSAWEQFSSKVVLWFSDGMEHTPALVMGLILVLLLPPLAVVGWILQRLQSGSQLTQRLRSAGVQNGGALRADMSGTVSQVFAGDAVLELVSLEGQESEIKVFPLKRGDLVVRIGREDDNDIQIRNKTVHRYHAAIDRGVDGGVAISDLSSRDGNGVMVNGKRTLRSTLRDGDSIALGAVMFRYRLNLQ